MALTDDIIANKQVRMKTGRQVHKETGAAYHERPAVTLERLARLEQVMLDEIQEIGKLVNGE